MCVTVSPFAEIVTKDHMTVRDRVTMGSCNIEPREEGPPWPNVVGHTEKKTTWPTQIHRETTLTTRKIESKVPPLFFFFYIHTHCCGIYTIIFLHGTHAYVFLTVYDVAI